MDESGVHMCTSCNSRRLNSKVNSRHLPVVADREWNTSQHAQTKLCYMMSTFELLGPLFDII